MAETLCSSVKSTGSEELSPSQVIEQLRQIQSQYYSENKKNIFFKKSQKLNCALETAKSFDIPTLFNCTTFQIPNTNKLFLDYTVFKLFANPFNYLELVTLLIDLVNRLIIEHGQFEAHLNLDSFSASAVERYIPLVKLFCSECLKDQSYTRIDKMIKLHIYNTPSLVNNVAKPLISVCDPAIKNKIVYYTKKESSELIQKLLEERI